MIPQTPTLLVLKHKIIKKQIAYLISTGLKKSWIKLCNANEAETRAILKYESDKNYGVEPIYYPQADDLDAEDLRALRDDGRRREGEGEGGVEQKCQIRYNLRERELQLIGMQEFYGVNTKEEKKEVGTGGAGSGEVKVKKQIMKKQQLKPATVRSNGLPIKRKLKSKKVSKKQQPGLTNSPSSIKKMPNQNKNTVIDVQKTLPKTKPIQKPPQNTNKNNPIEIFDGSDSELEFL